MTAVQLRPAPTQAAPSLAARARDVLAFEWTKLRSLRSNLITVSVAAIVTIGASAIVGRALSAAHKPLPGGLPALNGTFLAYAEYAVIPVSVLAVLQFTSEYGTGLIRTTFTAVPQRWAVLAGKAAVVGAAALVIGEVLAFACFWIVQAMASGGFRGLSLAQPGVTGAVLAGGFVLCACALTAVGMAAVIRSTPGAIIATLAAIYLLAGLCLVLPSPWKDDIGRFTMAFAAVQVTALHPQAGLLSPWASMLVLIAWPAAALLAAGLTLSRRDA
jgi:ABC-2 type transport system permease protein